MTKPQRYRQPQRNPGTGIVIAERLMHENRAAQRPLWTCPRCGARLVTRNMWHSCGRFSLEDLFAGTEPGTLEVAGLCVAMLQSLGDVQVIPQKTRLVCVARVRFGGIQPRKRGFLVSFALHRWLTSRRISRKADYGPGWRGHSVWVRSPADLDDELRSWLQESHDTVGLQSDRRTRMRPAKASSALRRSTREERSPRRREPRARGNRG
jgi:hypothetical protein